MIYYISVILQQASIHSIDIPTSSYMWYALKYYIHFEFYFDLGINFTNLSIQYWKT